MSHRVKYHVAPRTENGLNWAVKREGAERAVKIYTGKEAALQLAKQLAKRESLGQVIVHDKAGKIQIEYTYGEDPEKYKG